MSEVKLKVDVHTYGVRVNAYTYDDMPDDRLASIAIATAAGEAHGMVVTHSQRFGDVTRGDQIVGRWMQATYVKASEAAA